MSGAGAKPVRRRHAVQIAARTAGGLFGGYAIAALATMLLARGLPMERSEATVAATLISFAVYAVVALWAFAVRDVTRFWLWLLVLAVGLAGASWLAIVMGGRA